jgi:hypothetical protein
MPKTEWEVLPPEGSDGSTRPGPSAGAGTSGTSGGNRLALAFGIAVASDLASVFLEFAPPLQWTLDLATAAALFVVLGRQWLILPALVAEAIPGVAVLPSWVLVVGSIAMWGTVTPASGPPRS